MDKATLEQSMAKMDDMMAQMRAKMANLPPDQRAMIEQMAKQNGVLNFGTAAPQKPAVYDAQPTGGADTINGRACKLWNVTRDGVLNKQVCVASLSAMPGADEVVAASQKMSELFGKMGERMREQMASGLDQSGITVAKTPRLSANVARV